MAAEDREKQFERTLARHLSSASPSSVCPDAEILAAYHERTLSAEEMTLWKDHIASCARCQESLALVEQTENLPAEEWEHADDRVASEDVVLDRGAFAAAASAARTPADANLRPSSVARMTAPREISKPRHRPGLRWIVPLGAVAAATLVWIGVTQFHTGRLEKIENSEVAENRSTQPRPPQLTSPDSSSEAPALQDSARDLKLEPVPPAKVAAPGTNRIVPKQPPTSLVARGAASVAPAPADDLARKDKSAAPAGVIGGVIQPRSPSASSALPMNSMNSRATNAAASAPAPAPQAVAGQPNATSSVLAKEETKKAAEQLAVSAESPVVDSAAQSVSVTSSNAYSQLQVSQMQKVLDLEQAAQASRLFIVAPDQKHAWRVGDGGKIERSTDRGKTWKPQNSGVTADLTAGSATSEKVCWVVGKAGTLLLTTDGGKHWKQIVTPITGDLGGVHASDAMHVSIWDAPNRQSSQTSDGGVTWTRMANE